MRKPPDPKVSHEFVRLVKERILNKLTFYEIAILRELMQPEPKIYDMLHQLRSQQKDNPKLMREVLGPEAAALLIKLLP